MTLKVTLYYILGDGYSTFNGSFNSSRTLDKDRTIDRLRRKRKAGFKAWHGLTLTTSCKKPVHCYCVYTDHNKILIVEPYILWHVQN